MKTKGEGLREDAVIEEAKQKILNQVKKHSETITGLKSQDTALTTSYEESVSKLSTLRGIPLFYPYISSGIGNGALVEMKDGSVKYDFISGIGVHFGHSHPALIKASLDAAIEDTVMQGNLQQSESTLSLLELLKKVSGFEHFFLTTSGSMANENALKLLFQKKAPATRLLAFERCFMGRTLALAAMTDKADYRVGLPPNIATDYIPFYDWKDPEGSEKRAVEALKKALHRYPGAHACMCFELIQGEGGYYPGSSSFFKTLMGLLKENNIYVFVDEVQSFGRTGSLFAFQHFGLENLVDVVTVGKLFHVGVTMFRDALKPKPGLISQTFTSSTASIHSALAILHSLQTEGYLGPNGKNMQLAKYIVSHLEGLSKKHPTLLQGPFGLGLMVAFTPFNGEKERVSEFAKALYKNGVISFTAGQNPMRIRFLVPAGGITEKGIDEVAMIIEKTLLEMA